jgi:hypothetical protein
MGKFSFILAVMMMASWAVEIQGEDVETAWKKYQVCIILNLQIPL